MTDPKLIDHTLNNGALVLLSRLLYTSGLLNTPSDLRLAGDVADMPCMLELPSPPPFPDGTNTEVAQINHVRKWQRDGAHLLATKANQNEAIRKLLKSAAEKGALPSGPDTRCLLREFGVGDE